MATTYDNALQQLYVAYFNRPADPKGLAYWESTVAAANGDLSGVSAAFAASTEYQTTYAGLSSSDRVNAVYNNLFGHNADAAGLAYWANLLDTKQITVDAAVTAIAAGAQGTDMTAYNDKVAAATAFTAALTTDADVAGYAGAANAAAKTWLSTVTDANSLTAALDPATLATTVANIVATGTPFTLAGALAQLDAATTAVTNFATGVNVDVNKDGVIDTADIDAATAAAVTKVAGDLTTSGTLFSASTTSDSVREALITAQQAINSAQLSQDQATLTADNNAIAKVAGLSAAAATLTAAQTADASAASAVAAAAADLASKQGSFNVSNAGVVSISGNSLILTATADGSITTLGDVASNGKITLHSGVTASNYTGLTDLIASYNTDAAALSTQTKADANLANAQLAVNMLDIAPDQVGTPGHLVANDVWYVDGTGAHDTGMTESALIAAIAAQINTTTANSVAAGGTPTVSQIQTELAYLQQTGDTADYATFSDLISKETNGMSAAQAALTVTLNTDSATLAQDKTAAATAHNAYTGDVSTFNTAHTGVLSATSTTLVFTPTNGTATVVANIANHVATATAAGTAMGTDFGTLVTAYNNDQAKAATVTTDKATVSTDQANLTAAATINPLTASLTADNANVAADQKAISTLATDVAAYHAAQANSSTLAGLNATVTADEKVLSTAGYNVVSLDTDGGVEFGTAKSDVYVVNGHSETIGAFGLQGTDSLFVGTGYTLVQGAIGDTGVKGNNSAMEIFVSSNANGDAQLQIETHAYSSSVATTAGEIVTITLTGVDASTLHLDTNGIITSTPATTA